MPKPISRIVRARWLLISALVLPSADALAEREHHLDIGLRFSFLPAGNFALKYADNHIGAVDSASAFYALGFGAFVDYVFNPYIAVGVAPEAVLNVIPDVPHYNGGHMLNIAARLKLTYPFSRRVNLYGVFAPGYGIIFSQRDQPRGFTLSGTVGILVLLTRMNAVFAEVGYLAGFQRTTGERPGQRYSPSYLITSCGWRFSI